MSLRVWLPAVDPFWCWTATEKDATPPVTVEIRGTALMKSIAEEQALAAVDRVLQLLRCEATGYSEKSYWDRLTKRANRAGAPPPGPLAGDTSRHADDCQVEQTITGSGKRSVPGTCTCGHRERFYAGKHSGKYVDEVAPPDGTKGMKVSGTCRCMLMRVRKTTVGDHHDARCPLYRAVAITGGTTPHKQSRKERSR